VGLVLTLLSLKRDKLPVGRPFFLDRARTSGLIGRLSAKNPKNEKPRTDK
jgi:hypothetical protein